MPAAATWTSESSRLPNSNEPGPSARARSRLTPANPPNCLLQIAAARSEADRGLGQSVASSIAPTALLPPLVAASRAAAHRTGVEHRVLELGVVVDEEAHEHAERPTRPAGR